MAKEVTHKEPVVNKAQRQYESIFKSNYKKMLINMGKTITVAVAKYAIDDIKFNTNTRIN